MRLLVLGGTRFVGRAIVEQTLERGHEVTTFNRGQIGVDVAGVEAVRGDRESSADLHELVAGRSWDVVVDTSGYVPRVVGDAARALVGRAGQYVFLSTMSVYPDWPAKGVSEASPVYEGSPDTGGSAADEASWSATQYGSYKAGCERAVIEAFGDWALVLRAGVILGPHENVGRLTWWLSRIARGGRVLGPGDPDRPIQPIDVRDVVKFTLDLAESNRAGVFNVAAPKGMRPSARCSGTAPTPPAPTSRWCGSTTGSWWSTGCGSGPRSRCGVCTRAPGTWTRP
jgi:2'-hydroxyisoflavone reductase